MFNLELKKEDIGKVLFIISIILGFYLFITPLSHGIIHIDEYWTFLVVKLPLLEGVKVTISDVHPPLYYLILKFFDKLFIFLNINIDSLILFKILSILPYFIILLLSATKLKNEYGWFTAGLFALVLIGVSDFFIQFVTIRMYNWTLLFCLLSFIVLKDILERSEVKFWILLSIFVTLAAYTHYFSIITSALIYFIIFIFIVFNKNINFNKKEEFKKFLLSISTAVILYLPWIFILINQVQMASGRSVHEVPLLSNLINYFLIFGVNNESFSIEWILLKLFALALLIFIFYIFLKSENLENLNKFYVSSGIFLYFGTIILGVLLLVITFKPLQGRYLMPVAGILWLSICIILGKLKNNIFLIISLVLIILLCVGSLSYNVTNFDGYNEGLRDQSELSNLNNENNVIIYTQRFHYICFSNFLNKTTEYSTYKYDSPSNDIFVEENISKIVESNLDKNVYIIQFVDSEKDLAYEKNISYEKVYNKGHLWFIKLKIKEKNL